MTNSTLNDVKNRKLWVVIAAAGISRRMNSTTPKQYMALNQFPVITHTISQFLGNSNIAGVMVAIASNDHHWPSVLESFTADNNNPGEQRLFLLKSCIGGNSRLDSVISGLESISSEVTSEQWVLVHDAARPGLSQPDLNQLIDQLDTSSEIDGYLLASAMTDTLKRVSAALEIEQTVDRETIFAAQTPQVFRYQKLLKTLQKSKAETKANNTLLKITDEASAMELAGYKVKLIIANYTNFKITKLEDIQQMEFEIDKQLKLGIRIDPAQFFNSKTNSKVLTE